MDLAGVNFAGMDLAGVDLAGMDLAGMDLACPVSLMELARCRASHLGRLGCCDW